MFPPQNLNLKNSENKIRSKVSPSEFWDGGDTETWFLWDGTVYYVGQPPGQPSQFASQGHCDWSLVNKCYYVQVWLLKKASYICPSAHFQRQRSLGIVTHLPTWPTIYVVMMLNLTQRSFHFLLLHLRRWPCKLVLEVCLRSKLSLEKKTTITAWSCSRFLSFHTASLKLSRFKNNLRAFTL